MSFEPRDYLRHILVEADYLIGQSAGVSVETFMANENASASVRPESGDPWRGGKESS